MMVSHVREGRVLGERVATLLHIAQNATRDLSATDEFLITFASARSGMRVTVAHHYRSSVIRSSGLFQSGKYKLLCPRGTQTCALAVANIKVNGNGKVILDTHPESDQHQN